MRHLHNLTLLLIICLSPYLFSCESQTQNDTAMDTSTPKAADMAMDLPHPIFGSWKLKSFHQIMSDTTYHVDPSQPGLLMIDPNRYSIMWTPTRTPRVPFKNLSQPSVEEVQAGFRSIVFNAGTYRITEDSLITTAQIAKVPGFEGGKQFYQYEITNDLLHLTMVDETYPDGTKPTWAGKLEIMFVFKRVE